MPSKAVFDVRDLTKVYYCARGPIALDRLELLTDGRLLYRFKRAWRDGTTHIILTPHEMLEDGTENQLKILVLVSRDIIDEYLRVLTYPKFKLTKREIRFVLNRELLPYAILIQPKARIKAAPDPDDNKFTETAVSGKAKFLISGDRALLQVKRVRNVQIISPSAFLEKHAGEAPASPSTCIRKR